MTDLINKAKSSQPTEDVSLLKILECGICFEVPFGPVYNCINGHIFCFKCAPSVIKCKLCERRFSETQSRNYAVEALILSAYHKCKYKYKGCEVVMIGEEIQNHIDKCPYGGLCINCHFVKYGGNNNECLNVNVPLVSYLQHMKEKHMVLRSVTQSPGIVFDCCLSLCTDKDSTFWLGDYQLFNNDAFIVRQFTRDKLVYFSLAVLAEENIAQKYYTSIKLQSTNDKNCHCEWTVPVHSIIKTEDEVIANATCGVTTLCYLQAFCSTKPFHSHLWSSKSAILTTHYTIKLASVFCPAIDNNNNNVIAPIKKTHVTNLRRVSKQLGSSGVFNLKRTIIPN